MKVIFENLYKVYRAISDRIMQIGCCVLLPVNSFAEGGIIPVSAQYVTSVKSDFIAGSTGIFQGQIIPFIMILGSIWIVWTALSSLTEGVNAAKATKSFGPLKDAIITIVLVVGLGGGLMVAMNIVRTFKF